FLRHRRLVDVPRHRGARLPPAPAPRVRDGDGGARRRGGPLRLPRRRRALRPRRHPVAHRRGRDLAFRDDAPPRRRRPQPARAVPDLAQPRAGGQVRRAALRHVLGRADPRGGPRRRGRGRQVPPHRRGARRRARPRPAPALVGRATGEPPGHLDRLPRPGVSTELPAFDPAANRVLYNYGGALTVDDRELGYEAAVLEPQAVTVTAGPEGANVLVLQARPIGAPVVQQGPFVA